MRIEKKQAVGGLGAALLAAGVAWSGSAAHAAGNTPTFSKDVAPILNRRCVECHRPGAIAPMALTSYEEARPWARAIRQKVTAREMPPWGADPAIGKFANDPSLTKTEIPDWLRRGLAPWTLTAS